MEEVRSTRTTASSTMTKGGKGSRRKRVTIIVEDASDSENEDDEFSSVWRNRRPSPGQWLEPVDQDYV
jgi:hypothetical protein